MAKKIQTLLGVLVSFLVTASVAQVQSSTSRYDNVCPNQMEMGTEYSLTHSDVYSPKYFSLVAGGSLDLSRCPNVPGVGYIISKPDFSIRYMAKPGQRLKVNVNARCDTVLPTNTVGIIIPMPFVGGRVDEQHGVAPRVDIHLQALTWFRHITDRKVGLANDIANPWHIWTPAQVQATTCDQREILGTINIAMGERIFRTHFHLIGTDIVAKARRARLRLCHRRRDEERYQHAEQRLNFLSHNNYLLRNRDG